MGLKHCVVFTKQVKAFRQKMDKPEYGIETSCPCRRSRSGQRQKMDKPEYGIETEILTWRHSSRVEVRRCISPNMGLKLGRFVFFAHFAAVRRWISPNMGLKLLALAEDRDLASVRRWISPNMGLKQQF